MTKEKIIQFVDDWHDEVYVREPSAEISAETVALWTSVLFDDASKKEVLAYIESLYYSMGLIKTGGNRNE